MLVLVGLLYISIKEFTYNLMLWEEQQYNRIIEVHCHQLYLLHR